LFHAAHLIEVAACGTPTGYYVGMSGNPWNPRDVIEDMSEQIKQLTVNNTFLRSMLKLANERIAALESQVEDKPEAE
jgi:hypothetical protein